MPIAPEGLTGGSSERGDQSPPEGEIAPKTHDGVVVSLSGPSAFRRDTKASNAFSYFRSYRVGSGGLLMVHRNLLRTMASMPSQASKNRLSVAIHAPRRDLEPASGRGRC